MDNKINTFTYLVVFTFGIDTITHYAQSCQDISKLKGLKSSNLKKLREILNFKTCFYSKQIYYKVVTTSKILFCCTSNRAINLFEIFRRRKILRLMLKINQ